MNKLRRVISFFLLSQMLNARAQTSDSLTSKSINLYLSYNSSLIYPGERLGVELPIKSIELIKHKKKHEKRITKDRFFTAQVGWYYHPTFHGTLYFTGGWTMRRTNAKGFFTVFSPEIGFSRTFLGGTVYSVDTHSNVQINKRTGYYYGLVSVGGGLGYDFEVSKDIPFAVQTKFHLLLMYPYNSTYYLRPTFEIGIIYKSFLKRKTPTKLK